MAGGLSLPPAPQVLTGDDLIRAGACRGGVAARIKRLAGKIAAAEPPGRLLELVPEEERQHILNAIDRQSPPGTLDGSTYGYGDGDGYGNGYGDGDGNGNGDGDGNGDGYGDGDGNGYGDGDGNGNGYGNGYGNGNLSEGAYS